MWAGDCAPPSHFELLYHMDSSSSCCVSTLKRKTSSSVMDGLQRRGRRSSNCDSRCGRIGNSCSDYCNDSSGCIGIAVVVMAVVAVVAGLAAVTVVAVAAAVEIVAVEAAVEIVAVVEVSMLFQIFVVFQNRS